MNIRSCSGRRKHPEILTGNVTFGPNLFTYSLCCMPMHSIYTIFVHNLCYEGNDFSLMSFLHFLRLLQSFLWYVALFLLVFIRLAFVKAFFFFYVFQFLLFYLFTLPSLPLPVFPHSSTSYSFSHCLRDGGPPTRPPTTLGSPLRFQSILSTKFWPGRPMLYLCQDHQTGLCMLLAGVSISDSSMESG